MIKEIKTNEFAEMVERYGSLLPALITMARLYKSQIPPDINPGEITLSCYTSGAICAMVLLGELGMLTKVGERYVANARVGACAIVE